MASYPVPPKRRLRVFAFDPSLTTRLDTVAINQLTLSVAWENLEPGPVGEYLEIVDVDPASGAAYPPVDLNDPYLLAQDGLAPSEGDPRFHQQMLYAVAMITIQRFEEALGRRVLWSVPRQGHAGPDRWQYVQRLRIYPHALREANAYYSPDKKALLFGYFNATPRQAALALPGGLVFTCLSHDVIAHEVTHALLDGMHRRFAEPSNPDVLAFHEAFADLVALLQHFSYPDVLRHQLARTRGDLASQNLLGELAQEFGQAIGSHGALRDTLGRHDPVTNAWHPVVPDPLALSQATEPHARGSILVAAIFGAFLQIYQTRTADLLRIATAGTGILPAGALHPDLINRLAQEAASAARHMLRMCIRALDYCPPVDLTFGDYLRALITADRDVVADDTLYYRVALIDSFRRWGIYPEGVRNLSEESLLWEAPTDEEATALANALGDAAVLRGLCPDWGLSSNRRAVFDQAQRNQEKLQNGLFDPPHLAAVRALGLTIGPEVPASFFPSSTFKGYPTIEIHAVRPARRIGPSGEVRTDLVIVATQRRRGYFDAATQAKVDQGLMEPPTADFIFRGGCTLLVDLDSGAVRYAIRKDVLSEQRLEQQRRHLQQQWIPAVRGTYFGSRGELKEDGLPEPFAMLHRQGAQS
ncbi:hypothetical protein ACFST9_13675 [Hymenobacter monticola]|uniref:Peptidase M4 n=2 Tax=Hymenobacter TaxID=89966 RepID=A0ABY4BC34_9BACT|nr:MULTISPECIES: hypothetical protein [Hymenobacter]MDU0372236.1 hypothetical protein [Hymenobacter endophyticus]UOE36630.1 hypothetical protein MTP16_24375 [Hymenobacter monticola]